MVEVQGSLGAHLPLFYSIPQTHKTSCNRQHME